MVKPSPELLHKVLVCRADVGELWWRVRTPDIFANNSVSACKRWNTMLANKEAFTASKEGYRIGSIFDRLFYAHRVIWAMVHDEWPYDQIDHVDHNKSNNRIANLRVVSHKGNQMNASINSRNTSGVIGVSFTKSTSKWAAKICVDGHHKNLGSFSSKQDAIAARKTANEKYGFHENHGKGKTDE